MFAQHFFVICACERVVPQLPLETLFEGFSLTPPCRPCCWRTFWCFLAMGADYLTVEHTAHRVTLCPEASSGWTGTAVARDGSFV